MLSTFKVCLEKSAKLNETRLFTDQIKFHSEIRWNPTVASATKKKVTVTSKSGKSKAATINRDFLGALLNFQIKTGNMIDFDKALCHSLSPVPLNVSHAEGTKRETVKIS